MSSNQQPPNMLYPVANGVTSSNPYVQVFETRAPTSADVNYPVQKRWWNTTTNFEYILTGFSSTGGQLTANWEVITSPAALLEFTGGTGTAGTFPVLPNGSGQVELTSSDSSIVITGSANSLDFTTNGSVVTEVFQVDAATVPGVNPVTPNAGVVTVGGTVVAAQSIPVRTHTTALNSYDIELQYSSAVAATDATKVGLAAYNSAHFSVDANGFVELKGGGQAVDSFIPNSGTSPVVPDANGQITLQGAGSITVVGGLNSLTPQLTGLTANSVLLGNGTSTINPLPNSTTGTLLAANTGADPGWTSTLQGSFTFAKANSGADISVFVENLSNTAGSTALVSTQVAGSTASDAYFRSEISGGQSYAWGLDNSDSDAWVLAASADLGTTNVMRVNTSGEINFPLQSAFLAIITSSITDVTGDGTAYTIVYNSEIFDQNNDFDGTSTYTAPITSRVRFNAAVLFGGLAVGNTAANFIVVTSNRSYVMLNINPSSVINSGQLGFSGSCLADMDAGDTATVTATASGGTKVVDIISGGATSPRTWFAGNIEC